MMTTPAADDHDVEKVAMLMRAIFEGADKKKGDVETYNGFTRVAHSVTDIFDDGHAYPMIDIASPFLTTKTSDG